MASLGDLCAICRGVLPLLNLEQHSPALPKQREGETVQTLPIYCDSTREWSCETERIECRHAHMRLFGPWCQRIDRQHRRRMWLQRVPAHPADTEHPSNAAAP